MKQETWRKTDNCVVQCSYLPMDSDGQMSKKKKEIRFKKIIKIIILLNNNIKYLIRTSIQTLQTLQWEHRGGR